MAFDRFLDKAKNLVNDPKVKDKLNSEKAEKLTDSVLDRAAGAAESLTGGRHTEKTQKARVAADNALGTDGQEGSKNSSEESAGESRRDERTAGEVPGDSPSGSERPGSEDGPHSAG